MPKRPSAHRVGDVGVQEVLSRCAKFGWACDKNYSDYGEDIIAQTSINGRMDAFRVHFQVKTIEKRVAFGNNGKKFRVKRDLVRKWLWDPNYVVFVVWCIAENAGYWALPAKIFNSWELDNSKNLYVNIPIHSTQELDENSLKTIEWNARIRNYCLHLANAQSETSYLGTYDFDSKAELEKAKIDIKSEAVSICASFLESLGFICEERSHLHVSHAFFLDFQRRISAELKFTKDTAMDFDLQSLSFLFILFRMREISENVGVPPALLEGSMRLLSILIALNYPSREEQLPAAWR
jgi:hypothetical protein